jgi:hypothetical protein
VQAMGQAIWTIRDMGKADELHSVLEGGVVECGTGERDVAEDEKRFWCAGDSARMVTWTMIRVFEGQYGILAGDVGPYGIRKG